MPDDYRVTIRLSPELYTQLAARGAGQPMAAIVRDALEDYLTRQPDSMKPRSTMGKCWQPWQPPSPRYARKSPV